ncbi:hypothetical protein K2Q16_02365 [Patescibacteria group bacterium]|nr:hypothetical protein [Patescibacteria group bacterium]
MAGVVHIEQELPPHFLLNTVTRLVVEKVGPHALRFTGKDIGTAGVIPQQSPFEGTTSVIAADIPYRIHLPIVIVTPAEEHTLARGPEEAGWLDAGILNDHSLTCSILRRAASKLFNLARSRRFMDH